MASDIVERSSALDAILARSIVVDAHCDSIKAVAWGIRTLGERSDVGHLDLPRMRAGGIDAQAFACGLHIHGVRSPSPLKTFLQLADTLHTQATLYSDDLMLALHPRDIESAKSMGKRAGILSMEDGAPVSGSLEILRTLHLVGLRMLGLVWGYPNEIGEGVSNNPEARSGLTGFGVRLVRECSRLGIVIDTAHITEKGFWDVLEFSDKPIVNSHSNCRALYEHPRNLTDEQIRALADNGGVLCLTFTFAGDEDISLEDVLAHVEHAVDLVGPGHVGVGSDFDGLKTLPSGMQDASTYYRVAQGLLNRGYDADSISAIVGGNLMRVFGEVMA